MKDAKAIFRSVISGVLLAAFLFALYRFIGIGSLTVTQSLQNGSAIELAGVDWTANRRTPVIAVRPGCPWCTASAVFYRDILHSNSTNAFHVLAISPYSVQKTAIYLRSLGVNVGDVRQADLNSLGVQGTPTLVLVNQRGHIESTWIGQLSPEIEGEVFRHLGVDRIKELALPSALPTGAKSLPY